jgi:UDP-glucose 4-epimerase
VIRAYETVSGRKIPYRIAPRRPGDLAQYWADCSAAFDLLHWKATRSIENMCLDAWKWQLAASCPPVVT